MRSRGRAAVPSGSPYDRRMASKRVIVVGGGHNGLVAAILAAQDGHRVTLLEAGPKPGGATVSERVFRGRPTRLSRYSYLVSLFPQDLADRLGITLELASRTVSSYTPVIRAGRSTGLLVERQPGRATEDSFRELTGSGSEYRAWEQLYGELAELAQAVAPLLSGPLPTREQVRAAVVARAGGQIWTDLFEQPLGEMITRRFADDTVRGVVATDGLIGTHTSLFGESLLANRCFLYHLIGRGTGEWLVPVGGMGAVSAALLERAERAGVQVTTGVEVVAAEEGPDGVRLTDVDGENWPADTVLAAVAPATVAGWLDRPARRPVGAQLKVNMLLDRLPRLASGVDPELAFAGTTHLEEGFDALEAAYRVSAAGGIPDPLPSEVYCHSLTDPSIMAGQPGATLTLFGLHAPDALFRQDPDGAKAQALRAALDAVQRHLAEPLEDCLARDAEGELCLDVATPVDLERTLRMPGGNIFHADLSWPWREPDEDDSAAARFGVRVPGARRILQAGAGSRRGGGVSGLGGAAAVDALRGQ